MRGRSRSSPGREWHRAGTVARVRGGGMFGGARRRADRRAREGGPCSWRTRSGHAGRPHRRQQRGAGRGTGPIDDRPVRGCSRRVQQRRMSGGGHIVNTASMAGLYPGLAGPHDASKHAVVALTDEPLQHGAGGTDADRRELPLSGLGTHRHRRGRTKLAVRARRSRIRSGWSRSPWNVGTREGLDPSPPEEMPGLPPRSQMLAEVMAAMGMTSPAE